MARQTRNQKPARSDRPVAPRLSDDLPIVDLAGIAGGEWNSVELTGALPHDFDEPLLLSEVRLRGASLVGARLDTSRFVNVAIVASDLSGTDLHEASFTKVHVADSRLSGAQLAQMRLRDVQFTDCRLDDANIAMTVGERVRFDRCRMDRSDFRAAKFEGVAWFDCELTDAQFSQISVERAQLHGSQIDGLRGASDLAPLSIDDDQFAAFAAHLLAEKGIAITLRNDA